MLGPSGRKQQQWRHSFELRRVDASHLKNINSYKSNKPLVLQYLFHLQSGRFRPSTISSLYAPFGLDISYQLVHWTYMVGQHMPVLFKKDTKPDE